MALPAFAAERRAAAPLLLGVQAGPAVGQLLCWMRSADYIYTAVCSISLVECGLP